MLESHLEGGINSLKKQREGGMEMDGREWESKDSGWGETGEMPRGPRE